MPVHLRQLSWTMNSKSPYVDQNWTHETIRTFVRMAGGTWGGKHVAKRNVLLVPFRSGQGEDTDSKHTWPLLQAHR